MSILRGIQVNCTLPNSHINGRIRSAVATNVKAFIGQPILSCAADLVKQARKSVGAIRRHLEYSIAIGYEEESGIASLTIEVPAQPEIPVTAQQWYKDLQPRLTPPLPLAPLPSAPKSKAKEKKVRRRAAIEKEYEELQKKIPGRNDWRKAVE